MHHLVEGPVEILANLVGIGDIKPDRIDVGRFVSAIEIRRQVAVLIRWNMQTFTTSPHLPGGPARAACPIIAGNYTMPLDNDRLLSSR